MASIRKDIPVAASAEHVWDALRDVGALPTRLAKGFVTECRLDGEARIVTFANGLVAREVIVDIDDAARRLAYSVRIERLAHHNASFEVHADGPDRCRVVWIADVLPNAAAPQIAAMMEQGVGAMRRTLAAA